MKDSVLNDNSRCCVFRSGENWFGIGALAIHGIVPRPEIAELPHADASLKGVCHIQNEFIPVVSLRALSSIQYETSADAEQQLAILLSPQGMWGLLIDEATTLAELEISISNFSNDSDPWSRVVIGSASWNDQVLQILDPVAIHRYASRLLEMFWESSDQIQPQLTCN
jgi:chemotaxis signal transduction protein